MNESELAEYWAQAELCYFKADAAKYPASKQLWIQLAQDWIALAENLVPQSDQQNNYRQSEDKLTWNH
jgi:alpha-glucosidase (family GH31 glycosyl hydrolase)